MMKRGPQEREKKQLSATGLLKIVRTVFNGISVDFLSSRARTRDPLKQGLRGKIKQISLADSLMSALAMFSLKSPSLLAFDKACRDKVVSHNLKTLYGIENAPSDTYMREELDEVNPQNLRDCFTSIFAAAQRGKLLEKYQFLGGFLLLVDGTGLFNSENISCDDCCVKRHGDGRISYYHQALAGVIAHPNNRQVIPLCPELISKQDGTEKNDCERRALQRFLATLKKEHPRLKLTIASDALSANAPTINEIKAHHHHFIINAKPGSNKALFDWIDGLELRTATVNVGKNSYFFRYINDVPLNDAKDSPNVNFLECRATEINGKKVTEKTFTWITDHTITADKAYEIMLGGRARWKIENETFNTLKNQGYQFEHNFGHGAKHLMSVFALLMMLAFLIDQIQEATCGLFQAAIQKKGSRRAFWEIVRSYFNICFVNSWEDMFTAIGQSIGISLTVNSS
jgi:hypothetical protein